VADGPRVADVASASGELNPVGEKSSREFYLRRGGASSDWLEVRDDCAVACTVRVLELREGRRRPRWGSHGAVRVREQTLTSTRVDWVSSDEIDRSSVSSVAFQEVFSAGAAMRRARPCGMKCALFNLGGALPPRPLLCIFAALSDLGCFSGSRPAFRRGAMLGARRLNSGWRTAACPLRDAKPVCTKLLGLGRIFGSDRSTTES
jgi:hypothetical protein